MQLHDRSLPKLLELMADEAEFELNRLTVELTESALVDDLDLAGKVAEDVKQMGIHLALDDFGTGYSSLLHLQSLPFDELKVDASFVRSMTQSRQSRKITAAVVSLGLSLGLQTVAEGIEDQSQANLLAWQAAISVRAISMATPSGRRAGGPARTLKSVSRRHYRHTRLDRRVLPLS
jgi:EAL domain-containing protein (putative c-di-GMP-specific phosphodiesterase class I)